MKIRSIVLLFAALVLVLGLPGVSVQPVEAQQGAPGFARVSHVAIGVPAVDIYLNNAETPAITNLEFGKATGWLPLAAGSYAVRVTPTGDAATNLLRATVAVRANEGVEIWAQGNAEGTGNQTPRIRSARANFAVPSGKARVFAVHALPGGGAVDVLAGDTAVISNLVYGNLASVDVDPGIYNLSVSPTRTTEILLPLLGREFKAGHIYTIFVTGTDAATARDVSLESLALLPAVDPTPATGTVRITHASKGAPAVDIYLNNARTPAVAALEYGQSTDLISLAAGTYTVAIRPAGARVNTEAVFTTSLDVAANTTTEVLATGVLGGEPAFGLSTYPITRSLTRAAARVYLIHAAAEVGAVDVRANGEVILANFEYGQISPALELDPADLPNVAVLPAGRPSPVLFRLAKVDLERAGVTGDFVYTIIADPDAGVRGQPLVLAAPGVSEAAEGKTGSVRVTHVATAPAVDVYLAGSQTPVAAGLAAGRSTDILTLPTGEYTVELRPAGDAPVNLPLFSQRVIVNTGDWIEAVAFGTLGGETPTFDVKQIKLRNNWTNGQVRVFAFHAAEAAPRVDVYANGNRAIADFRFGNVSDGFLFDAGSRVNVNVVPRNQRSPVVAYTNNLQPDANTVQLLIAWRAGQPLLRLERTFPGNVRIVHASPDAPAVDIYVDGVVAVKGLAFGAATGFVSLPAGDHAVAIRPAGAAADTAPVFETTLSVPSGISAEVVALGKLGDASFTVGVFPISRDVLAGKSRVYVIHAAPSQGAVNVTVNGSNVLEGVTFPNYNAQPLEVDAGTYDIYAVDAANPSFYLVNAPQTTLEPDTIYTVLAYGDPIINAPLVLTSDVRK